MAGLNLALLLSEIGDVTLLTKAKIDDSSSYMAQGGIAAVVDFEDSFEDHIRNTLDAGSHHNDEAAVRFLVENAPAAIDRLKDLGVRFESKSSKEGGHNFPRVHHTLDQTGKAITGALIQKIQEHPRISILENSPLLELHMHEGLCVGASFLKEDKVESIQAKFTILATGGLGQLYSKTSNPSIATGDGIAIAAKAGAKMKNLEFVQFHPTGFLHNDETPFLLSETLRGEGGVLRNAEKKEFMKDHHQDGNLAPRDIVTRAIFEEMKKGTVYLDLTHLDPEFTKKRFPYLYQKLNEYEIDFTKDLIPISPLAHFSCGGIEVDLEGKTSVPKLYAIGEVACNGVHGANRLASNSLLENMVFAQPIVDTIKKEFQTNEIPIQDVQIISEPNHFSIDPTLKETIQDIMWNNVGIKRNREGLEKALEIFENIETDSLETMNMLEVAKLITKAALERTESLGCHWRD